MSFIEIERLGAVARLTLNRPESMNALGLEGDGEAVERLVADLAADRALRCVVLTGAGKAFCAGGDLKAMQARTGTFAGSPAHIRDQYAANVHRIIGGIAAIGVPTIAAINGAAIGLGCDLACACDIRIASDRAKFSVPFLRIGLVPGDGGAWLLPRVIGMSRASQLLFTGDAIDAATALGWGLVNEVVAAGALTDHALAMAERIAGQPVHALKLTKSLLKHGQGTSYQTLMEMSAMAQAILHHTEDHHEGVASLLEKRPPVFSGN